MIPLSPHPGSTAGNPCVSSLIRADRARTPSPAAPSSPQPGLFPRCGRMGNGLGYPDRDARTGLSPVAPCAQSAAKKHQGAAVANADKPSANPALYPTQEAA